jgi:hypothetical protein
MKNIVSLLALIAGSAVCTTAMAQVSALDQLSNSSAYTLSRQASSGSGLANYVSGSTNVKVGGSVSNTADEALWAIHYSEKEKAYYLYNLAAKQFVTGNDSYQAVFTASAIDVLPVYLESTASGNNAGYWMLDCGGYYLGMSSDNEGATIFADDLTRTSVKSKAFSFIIKASTARTISDAENTEIEQKIAEGRAHVLADYQDFVDKAHDFDKDGLTNYAGGYDVTALEYALNNPDKYTLSEIEALYREALTSKYPQAGKYYRLRNYSRPSASSKNNVLSLTTSNTLKARTLSRPKANNATSGYQEDLAIMQFVFPTADYTQAQIRVCATGQYLGSNSDGVAVGLTEKTGAYTYTIQPKGDYSRLFSLADPTNSRWLTVSGGYELVGYGYEEDPELWYFEEVESISVTPDANGYLLLTLPANVSMPEGCTAYNIPGEYEGELYAEEISGYVPAGTPFLLHSNGGKSSVELPVVSGSKTLSSALTGTNVTTSAPDRHVLSTTETAVNFTAAAAGTVKPNTAYYNTTATTDIPVVFDKKYPFSGINTIEADQISADDMYFDLQGRRVVNPTKGFYINGTTHKTVLVK